MTRGGEPRDLLKAALDRQPLFELLETQTATRSEVQSVLGVSRSTVHRIIKRFESEGLLTYQDGRYGLTPLGQVVAEKSRNTTKTVAVAERMAPLLPTLNELNGDFDYMAFADANLVTPEEGDPFNPIRRITTKINQVDSLQEISLTVPEPAYLRTLLDRAREDLCAAVVYPRRVVERLRKMDEVAFETAIEKGSLRVRIDDPPPFRLILADDCVFLIGYNDEASRLQLVVDADSAAASDWASKYFQNCWAAATSYETEYENPPE